MRSEGSSLDLIICMSSKKYAHIVIPRTNLDHFTYSIPEDLLGKIYPGAVVIVPFQKTRSKGVVWEIIDAPELPEEKIKPIEEVISSEFSLAEPYLKLAEWMRDYYLCTLSDIIPLLFPPGVVERGTYIYKLSRKKDLPTDNPVISYLLKIHPRGASLKRLQKLFGAGVSRTLKDLQAQGLITLTDNIKVKSYRELDFYTPFPIEIPAIPTPSQKEILDDFFKNKPKISLIFGVTGSGKTRLYSWIVEEFMKEGESALILVPEIALTPQIFNYLINIFHGEVMFYHSRLSDAERRWVFKQAKEGKRKILVGPRSALFVPLQNLGVIIIDEEHDSSYKECEKIPAYHSRDVAIKLSEILNIPVILGSASPSLESYYNALKGDFAFYKLKQRVPHYKIPQIEIIDLRKVKGEYLLSPDLISEINKTLERNRQVILFINRRGHSTFLMCLECGYIMQCPDCSVNMVYHKTDNKMHCHVCGKTLNVPEVCPSCGSIKLQLRGTGTQKVEEAVSKFFKNLEVKRFDLDSFLKEGVNQNAFREFYEGKLKLLVGTKMVGKGFDFPGLGLIGVVNADIGLGMPDFRAEERVFQLLLQIAGRIRTGGKVLIQTYNPNSRAIKFVKELNYEGFAESELSERERYDYPPFSYLTLIELSGKSMENIVIEANKIKERINGLGLEDLQIMGPVPSPISKKGGNYFIRLILKYKSKETVYRLNFLREYKTPSNINLTIDVDPQELV